MVEIKKVQLMLEWLAKSETNQTRVLYMAILDALDKTLLCSKTRFTCKQIEGLIKAQTDSAPSVEGALSLLRQAKEKALPSALREKKEMLVKTFFGVNFPEKKEFLKESMKAFEAQLSPVEAKMYQLIGTYLSFMEEAMELFVLLDSGKEASLETFSAYVLELHEAFLSHLFYKEERPLVAEGLGKMGLVLMGVYYKDLYM